MSTIQETVWTEFTKQVAAAQSAGHHVEVLTGSEANGAFVARVFDDVDDVLPAGGEIVPEPAPEPAPEPKTEAPKTEAPKES